MSVGLGALLAARGDEAPLAGPERRRREETVAHHAHRRRILEVGRVDADALLQHDVACSQVPRRHHEPGISWIFLPGAEPTVLVVVHSSANLLMLKLKI